MSMMCAVAAPIYEAEGYRQTVRALRRIGRDCIEQRIKALRQGEEVPHDILSQILQLAGIIIDDSVMYPTSAI